MSVSNHTSFMTAEEQASPRNSLFNLNSANFRQSFRHSIKSQYKPSDASQISRNIKQEVGLRRQQLDNIQHSFGSSFSSGDLESRHSVINDSPALNHDFGEKEQSRDDTLIAEGHPHQNISESTANLDELRTYPIAWLLLFFIVILRAAIAIFGNTFSPIPSITAEFMGISLSSINWLYNTMAICYIIASFFTSWIYKTIGVKWSLVLSGFILSAGCWIRWVAVKISPPSFPILMIGQSIASLSSPISLNITTMFATLWFTQNRQATAGMFIVSNYGAIIAMFLMPSLATGKDKIELTTIVVASIATVATIPLVFFPKKPLTPAAYKIKTEPSVEQPEISLRAGTVMLLKNPHFLTLCVIHGLNIGLSVAWNGLMNQAITPYGYTDHQVGNIAAIGVVGGTLGCLISGPAIDKTKQHKILLKIMAPLMVSTYVAFIFVVKAGSFAAILYTNALSQFFLSFMVPICIELGVEISYPVPESLSTSILWQTAQAVGFVLVIIMDLFREIDGVPKNNMYKALVFQATTAGVCLLFVLVFNGPMSRTEALKEQQESREAEKASSLKRYIHSPSSAQYFSDSSDTLHTLAGSFTSPKHGHSGEIV